MSMRVWRSLPAQWIQRSNRALLSIGSEANADRRDRPGPHGRQHVPPPDEGGTHLRRIRRQCQAARGAGERGRHGGEVAGGSGKALKEKSRAVWVMLPAGQITEETVERLGGLLEPDDIIIDGGNSFYKDDIRRAKKLADKRIH